MKLSEKQMLFTFDVYRLIQYAWSINYTLTFGEVYRTEYQQKEYVRLGLSRTMNSRHLQRLAVDFNVFKNGVLIGDKATIKPLGDYWESLDDENKWGGNFKSLGDYGHFERTP